MAGININGSLLEGGGQVLRVAIASAVVHGQTIEVHNIRGGRAVPGLAPQHLKGLEMVANVCGGKLQGAVPRSLDITLKPCQIKPGKYCADTQTAGSVTLLVQAVLPISLYAKGPTELVLLGGTNADMAPPADYTASVFTPVAAKFGVLMSLDIVRRGFYPRGGGELRAKIEGLTSPLQPVILDNRGTVLRVSGTCHVSALPPRLATVAIDVAVSVLRSYLDKSVIININKEVVPDGLSGKGLGIVLWCETDTGVILGSSCQASFPKKKGPPGPTPAEEVGRRAAEQLCEELQAGVCVDREMQNQVIILMGLAAGRSSILCSELSLHTKTAIEIMQQTSQAKFTVKEEGDLFRVECDGVGVDPNNLPCTT